MKILVLDVGTSSMRGILYNCGGTKLLEEASPYCAKYLPGGQVQQDVAEWENAMWQILRSAAERAKANGWTIDAVSMTAQRSSVIAADGKNASAATGDYVAGQADNGDLQPTGTGK